MSTFCLTDVHNLKKYQQNSNLSTKHPKVTTPCPQSQHHVKRYFFCSYTFNISFSFSSDYFLPIHAKKYVSAGIGKKWFTVLIYFAITAIL
jgi:hypothetical protein